MIKMINLFECKSWTKAWCRYILVVGLGMMFLAGMAKAEEGLVLHYTFDEGSGETARDISGNNNHGKISGAAWVKDKYGYALSFDGVDDYIDCGKDSSLGIPEAITLEAWIYPRDISGKEIIWVYRQYQIEDNKVIIWIGNQPYRFDFEIKLPNYWYHLAVTCDTSSRTVKVFINGERVSGGQIDAGRMNTDMALPLQIGRVIWRGEGGVYFKGLIDEVRIYSKALSEDEVKAHYEEREYPKSLTKTQQEEFFSSLSLPQVQEKKNSPSISLPHTLIYLFFDEEQNVIQDKSGHDNPGFATGVTWEKGVSGSAIKFPGNSGWKYVHIPYREGLDLTKEMAVEFWINLLSMPPEPQTIAYKRDSWEISIHPNSILQFFLLNHQRLSASIPLKEWVQVAATYDGGVQKLFINGVLVQSKPSAGKINTSKYPIMIGASIDRRKLGNPRQLENCLIDEFRLLSSAITPFYPVGEDAALTFSLLPEGKATLNIARCKRSPLIDGILNDASWKETKEVNLKDSNTGEKASVETKAYITYDEGNLYAGFFCQEPQMEKIAACFKQNDVMDIFRDDCIEIFLQRGEDLYNYYHLTLNSLGSIFDALRENKLASEDAVWDSHAKIATSRDKDSWAVEVSIPFSSLGGDVQQGEIWRANFNRERHAGGEQEFFAWSPTKGSFHQPRQFGMLGFNAQAFEVAASKEKESIREPATLIGVLIDENGGPAQSVRIENDVGGETDYTGRFVMEVSSGKHIVSFSHPKYALLKGEIEVQAPVTVIAPLPIRLHNPYRFNFSLPASPKGYRICKINNYLDKPATDKSPPDEDFTDKISLFAARGEYEPVSFLIYAGTDMEEVKIKPGRLENGRHSITEENIEVRWVRDSLQRMQPKSHPVDSVWVDKFLVRKEGTDISKGEFRQVWITVRVPEEAKPGSYKSELEVKPSNLPSSKITLNLEVLPFALEEHPRKRYGMFYSDYIGVNRAKDTWKLDLKDMREHGVNSLIWNRGPLLYYRKNGNGEIEIDYGEVERMISAMLEHGFLGPFIVDSGVDQIPRLLGHKDMNWWGGYRGDGKELNDDPRFWATAKKAIIGLLELKKRNNWPEIYITHGDEPFSDFSRVRYYIQLSKAVRQVPGCKIMISMPRNPNSEMLKEADPYIDIRLMAGEVVSWFLSSGHIFKELEEELRESGDEAWIYVNPSRPYILPVDYRLINGLLMWASPISMHMPWIYDSCSGNPFDSTDDIYTDMGFATIDPDDGTIMPTKHWEAFREGIDDMKYLYTLEQYIKKGEAKHPSLAKEAEGWLKELRTRIQNLKPEAAKGPFLKALAQDSRYKCAQYIAAFQ